MTEETCNHENVSVEECNYAVYDTRSNEYHLGNNGAELVEEGDWRTEQNIPDEYRVWSVTCDDCGETLFEDGSLFVPEDHPNRLVIIDLIKKRAKELGITETINDSEEDDDSEEDE